MPTLENCYIVLNIVDMKTVNHLSNCYTHRFASYSLCLWHLRHGAFYSPVAAL